MRTVRKWLARFRAGGQAALANHASAPARVSGRLEAATVALIVHPRRTLRMTDNGSAYRSGRFAKALRLLAIRCIFTLPYTPKTNGKAERFVQTLLRERAYGLAHPSSQGEKQTCRTGLTGSTDQDHIPPQGGLSPLSRVNNLIGTHGWLTYH